MGDRRVVWTSVGPSVDGTGGSQSSSRSHSANAAQAKSTWSGDSLTGGLPPSGTGEWMDGIRSQVKSIMDLAKKTLEDNSTVGVNKAPALPPTILRGSPSSGSYQSGHDQGSQSNSTQSQAYSASSAAAAARSYDPRLLQKLNPRELELFQKYFGGRTGAGAVASAAVSKAIGSTDLNKENNSQPSLAGVEGAKHDNKVLMLKNELNNRELEVVELRSMQLKATQEFHEMNTRLEQQLREKEEELKDKSRQLLDKDDVIKSKDQLFRKTREDFEEKAQQLAEYHKTLKGIASAQEKKAAQLLGQLHEKDVEIESLKQVAGGGHVIGTAEADELAYLREMAESLRKENRELRVRLQGAGAGDAVGSATEETRKLREELNNLKGKAEETKKKDELSIRTWQEEVRRRTDRVIQLERLLAEKDDEYSCALKDLEKKFSTNVVSIDKNSLAAKADSQREVDSLKQQLEDKLREQENAFNAQLGEIQPLVEEAETLKAKLSAMEKEKTKESQDLRDRNESLEKAVRDHEITIRRMESDIRAKNAEIRDMESFQSEMAEENAKLRNSFAEVEASADRRVEEMRRRLERMKEAQSTLTEREVGKLRREMWVFLSDVKSLTHLIRQRLNNEQPNVTALFGATGKAEDVQECTTHDIDKTRREMDELREDIIEKYAEKVGESCQIQ